MGGIPEMNHTSVDIAGVEQHSLARSIALHLLPGALISLFYIVAASFAPTIGFPSGIALFVSIGVILVPFELGILLSEGRRKNGRLSLKGIVLFREPMPWWQYVALGVPLFMWLGVVFMIFAPPLDSIFINRFFAWLPDWFFWSGRSEQLTGLSRSALAITAILNLLLNGVAGPVVEEMYFRGFLLPRLNSLKGWAPLLNVLLFSLYHFFSPWQNPARIIGYLPMVYVVWWKRNIYLGMIVHCLGNTVGALGMLALVFAR
jgi:membrane protease YdiL (CAAX protease family)